jgi:hypothetical protein
MQRTLDDRSARRLAARTPLRLDPDDAIAIKRDVHELEVGCDAARFTRAFRDVVIDATSSFGLIRIRRPEARMGRDFELGERFQGCFSLERAVLGALERRGLTRAQRVAAAVLARPAAARLVTWIEDQMLSDYAEIEELVLDPPPGEPFRLRYRYLDGTPIAGSSVFVVEPLAGDRCRVRQIFEYQEIGGLALGSFQRFGLKYHDQVVHMQIHQAAQRAGAAVLRSTIPADYARMVH